MSTSRSLSSRSSVRSSVLSASQGGTSLDRLNKLLNAFAINLAIPKLSSTPPALLLALFEAVIGERLDSPSAAVRASREREDRQQVCDTLALALQQTAAERAVEWEGVDTGRLEGGRRNEVGVVVELLWSLAAKAELSSSAARTDDDDDDDVRTEAGERSRTAALLWPQETPVMTSTPLDQPTKRRPPKTFSPAAAPSLSRSTLASLSSPMPLSTRPTSSMSNASSASRSLLHAMSTTSPPPLTPTKRSTLSLLSRADATALPPLLMLPPELRTGPFKPVPTAVKRPIARRAVQVEQEEPSLEASYLNGKRKGKSKQPTSECSCDGHTTQLEQPYTHSTDSELDQNTFRVPQTRRTHRAQPPTSSSPPSPPRPPPKVKLKPKPPKQQPPQLQRAQSQPQSTTRAKQPPARSSTSIAQVRSSTRASRLASGFHSVVGESEIEAFENNKRRAASLKRSLGDQDGERALDRSPDASFGLEMPEGWEWASPDALEGGAYAPPPELGREDGEEDEYTTMLLGEKTRLLSQLRDLKLQQLAIENAAGGAASSQQATVEGGLNLDRLAHELSTSWRH